MQEIFDDIFASEPRDPTEAARRTMAPPLRKRFYDRAEARETGNGWAILLDGKPVRTPARRVLAMPVRRLAEALAAEWEAQREVIDPARMPLTRLVNSIIDGVAETPDAVTDDVGKYLGSDLLHYRANSPQELVELQARHWDPVLDWVRDRLGAEFAPAQGVIFQPQPEAAVAAARAAIPKDPWRLGAIHAVTTLTGSALLALALAGGQITIEAAWQAAHVDEDWNMRTWGCDEIALARRDQRFAEMRAAAAVLDSLRQTPTATSS